METFVIVMVCFSAISVIGNMLGLMLNVFPYEGQRTSAAAVIQVVVSGFFLVWGLHVLGIV